jgi:hypothetical protein
MVSSTICTLLGSAMCALTSLALQKGWLSGLQAEASNNVGQCAQALQSLSFTVPVLSALLPLLSDERDSELDEDERQAYKDRIQNRVAAASVASLLVHSAWFICMAQTTRTALSQSSQSSSSSSRGYYAVAAMSGALALICLSANLDERRQQQQQR